MTNREETTESIEESSEVKAFKRYLHFAERNDVASQIRVAEILCAGQGVEKNEESAIAWYKKAAASGNIQAMKNLAQIYERSKNEEANYWWIKLAETGDTLAEYKTALLCLKSSNVKKHAQGVLLLKKAAEKKFTKAEYFLGVLFIEGKSVKKSTEMGYLFLKQAADKNFVLAQRRLGIELFKRDEKDCLSKEAFYWLSEGAKNEDGQCFYFLGHCFLIGKGTHKSKKDAFYCFEKAASRNIAEAQHALACCYINSTGVQRDEGRFLDLLHESSKNGDLSAKYKLSEIILHELYATPSHLSEECAIQMLKELSEKNHIKGTLLYARHCGDGFLSFKLYERMASLKVVEAFGSLAYAYENGLGVKRSQKKANYWRKKDCEYGDAKKQYSYASGWYYGFGLKRDKKKAFKWFYEAGKNDFTKAFYMVGECFGTGAGTKRDPAKAILWYTKAAESGDSKAMYDLWLLYQAGSGNQRRAEKQLSNLNLKGRTKAFEWFIKSAELGYTRAQNELGVCYLTGNGVEKDERKAIEWLIKSAERGDALCQNAVAWVMATSSDPIIRNGKEAEKWAKKAIAAKGSSNPDWMDTLSAAYAEQGKFADAVSTQKKAISILKKQDVKKRKEFNEHLKAYQGKKPWQSGKTALA